ncbi:MAG: transglutaminase domain-containing protein [Eubacteriaceae bacterium]|nr:transglutaminase domain-containing protein [Eubacteriaceae bacterium]
MRRSKLKKILSFIMALMCLFFVFSCNPDSNGENEISLGDDPSEVTPQRSSLPVILQTTPSGVKVYKNDYAEIDYSEISKGFINVKYIENASKAKLQITSGSVTYTYSLTPKGEYAAFPLSAGSASYSLGVFKNISGDKYAQVAKLKVSCKLEDVNSPFLYPNVYVDYSESENLAKLSEKLAKKCVSDVEVVEEVYDHVVKKMRYDSLLAENPPANYIPDIERILDEYSGICFDYASLMTALLRSQSIPAKLIIGYRQTEYHAWISVYLKETGWVDGMIYFDGQSWVLMDPTLADSFSGSNKELSEFLKNSENYNALYYY